MHWFISATLIGCFEPPSYVTWVIITDLSLVIVNMCFIATILHLIAIKISALEDILLRAIEDRHRKGTAMGADGLMAQDWK